MRLEDKAAIDEVFGTQGWLNIYKMRLDGSLTGGEAREEYLNLMRWLLQTRLGYEWTHPLELKNIQGSSIYFMIFATAHKVGNKIMSQIYNTAASKIPVMRLEAIKRIRQMEEEASGVQPLFEDDGGHATGQEIDGRENLYVYEPPHPPPGAHAGL